MAIIAGTSHLVSAGKLKLPKRLLGLNVGLFLRCVGNFGLFLRCVGNLDQVGCWVPNTGYTRTRDTRYLQAVDVYWQIKTVMRKVLIDRLEEQ